MTIATGEDILAADVAALDNSAAIASTNERIDALVAVGLTVSALPELRTDAAVTSGDSTVAPNVTLSSVDFGRAAVIGGGSNTAEGAKVDASGQIVPISGTFADHADSVNIIIPEDEYTSRHFGVSASNSATVNTRQVQTMVDAAAATLNRVKLLPGLYAIDDTIELSNLYGTQLIGNGTHSTANGFTLNWEGGSTVPAILMTSCREVRLSGIRIRTENPLAYGIRMQRGATLTPQLCLLQDVVIDATAVSNLGVGVSVDDAGAGGDGNNDFHTFERVYVKYAQKSFAVDASQAFGMRFINCVSVGDNGGWTEYALWQDGGSFQWYGGSINRNSEYDFRTTNLVWPSLIDGLTSEHSSRFLNMVGPTTAQQPLTVRALRFDRPVDYFSSDNVLIKQQSAGALTIQNSTIRLGGGDNITLTLDAGNDHQTMHIEDVHFRCANDPTPAITKGRVKFVNNNVDDGTTYERLANTIVDYSEKVASGIVSVAEMVTGFNTPTISTLGSVGGGLGLRIVTMPASNSSVIFTWRVPDDYHSTLENYVIFGMSTAETSKVVVWQMRVYKLEATDDLNTGTLVDVTLSTVTASNGANELQTDKLQTLSGVTAGDVLRVELHRRGDQAADTHGGSARLVAAEFRYVRNRGV